MIVQRNPLSPNLFKHSRDEDKGRDHQGQDVLIFYDKFSFTSSIRNAWRKVRRMCSFISGHEPPRSTQCKHSPLDEMLAPLQACPTTCSFSVKIS